MKHFLTITFLVFCLTGFGQVTKEIKKGILLTFPEEPEYFTDKEGAANYRIETKTHFIMARVNDNGIPNYSEIQKELKNATQAEVAEFENSYLDFVCKELFDSNAEITKFKLGKYPGRLIKTKMKLSNGKDYAKRFIKLVLAGNTLIVIEAGYVDPTEAAIKIKDNYLNSLRLK